VLADELIIWAIFCCLIPRSNRSYVLVMSFDGTTCRICRRSFESRERSFPISDRGHKTRVLFYKLLTMIALAHRIASSIVHNPVRSADFKSLLMAQATVATVLLVCPGFDPILATDLDIGILRAVVSEGLQQTLHFLRQPILANFPHLPHAHHGHSETLVKAIYVSPPVLSWLDGVVDREKFGGLGGPTCEEWTRLSKFFAYPDMRPLINMRFGFWPGWRAMVVVVKDYVRLSPCVVFWL